MTTIRQLRSEDSEREQAAAAGSEPTEGQDQVTSSSAEKQIAPRSGMVQDAKNFAAQTNVHLDRVVASVFSLCDGLEEDLNNQIIEVRKFRDTMQQSIDKAKAQNEAAVYAATVLYNITEKVNITIKDNSNTIDNLRASMAKVVGS